MNERTDTPGEGHWEKDRPETDEQAIELLRFGAVMNHVTDVQFVNQTRTEARMLACADYFEKRLASSEKKAWKRGEQRIVCAALRDAIGRLVVGPRHFDAVMREQIKQAGGTWKAAEQGFINQFGEFLSREHARKVAAAQGQLLDLSAGDPPNLYSENLY